MSEPGRAAGRPTRDAAAGIRREILAAALREFGERGFHGGSIAGIAARAEVSRRTVYNQFQTKEQMFDLLVQDTSGRLRDRIVAVLASAGATERILFELGMCFHEDALGVDGRAMARLLIIEARNQPEIARKGVAARRAILLPIAAYLAGLTRDGELAVDDPDRAAQQFLNLTTNSVDYLLGELDHASEEQRRLVAAAVHTFLHGVARR